MAELMTLDEVRNWCGKYPDEKDPIFVQDGYDYGHWIINDEDEEDFFTQVIMGDLKCWSSRPTKGQMIDKSEMEDNDEYYDLKYEAENGLISFGTYYREMLNRESNLRQRK